MIACTGCGILPASGNTGQTHLVSAIDGQGEWGLGFVQDVLLQRAKNFAKGSLLRSASFWRETHARTNASELPRVFVRDCMLCARAGAEHTVVGAVPVTFEGRLSQADYRLVRCHACETVYLDPFPSDADLKLLYEETEQFDDARFTSDAARITDVYARRMEFLGLLSGPGRSVLEVGAGLAWISRAAKARDPGARTVAQDVSSECAGRCPWVDEYVVGPLEHVRVDPAFDLVSLTHVIEHVLQPRAMLAGLRRYVADTGHIYITAPFHPPFWKPRHGLGPWLHYAYLHVPGHIAYLSERWMRESAQAAGFTLVHWDSSHDGHQVFEALLRKETG